MNDEKTLELANVVDGLFAIANALNRIAGAIGSSRRARRKSRKQPQRDSHPFAKLAALAQISRLPESENKAPTEWPAPFNIPVSKLPLSTRARNCFHNNSIVHIGDLVQKTEVELLRTPNFGRKSLNDIKEILAQMGLHLGMLLHFSLPSSTATAQRKETPPWAAKSTTPTEAAS